MSVLDNYECEGQMSMFDLYGRDFSYGRMYQGPSVLTREKTSEWYSKRFAELRIKMPQFLDLRKGNGVQADASWDQESSEYIRWLGGLQMRSFGELPSAAVESHLSEILEENAHPKYYLSPKACQGILRRAASRGKELPPILKEALIRQSVSKNEPDAVGGGKGILIQKDRIGALSTLNNQSVLDKKCLNPWEVQSKRIQPENGVADALYSGEKTYGGGQSYVLTVDEKMGNTYIHEDCANTMGARDYKQPQAVCYGISGYESNAMKSSNPHSGIYEADTTRTLDLNGGNSACNQGGMMVVEGFDAYNQALTGQKTMSITGAASDSHHIPSVVCLEGNGQRESHKGDGYKESDKMYTLNTVEQHAVCVSQDAYDKYSLSEKAATIKQSGGVYGGVRGIGDTVGALCRCDYKGVGSQYVSEGKCIVQNIGESSE